MLNKTRIPLYLVGIDVGGTNTDAVLLKFVKESALSNGAFASTLLSSDSDRTRLGEGAERRSWPP